MKKWRALEGVSLLLCSFRVGSWATSYPIGAWKEMGDQPGMLRPSEIHILGCSYYTMIAMKDGAACGIRAHVSLTGTGLQNQCNRLLCECGKMEPHATARWRPSIYEIGALHTELMGRMVVRVGFQPTIPGL